MEKRPPRSSINSVNNVSKIRCLSDLIIIAHFMPIKILWRGVGLSIQPPFRNMLHDLVVGSGWHDFHSDELTSSR